MKRFLPFITIALTIIPSRAMGENPPNFVFIIADDLGWADVAFREGNAPTSHLDKPAAESLELTQHYVAPVFSPTRAGFLTGRLWSSFGITMPIKTEECRGIRLQSLELCVQSATTPASSVNGV